MAKKNTPTYTKEEAKLILKGLVRTKYDYQDLRIRTGNRLEKKKDWTDQQKPESQLAVLDIKSVPDIVDTFEETERLEKELDRRIASYLKLFPIYNDFLKDVKGCGPAMSAVIISEFDIEKAETVSKLWQFAGMNPGDVFGKKRDGNGTVTTTERVRGDRPTSGYIIPYNKFLRTRLLGVLADCMIKCKSPYTMYYYNTKQQLANSQKCYKGDEARPWNKESKAHIDRAAKRKMIKEFLRDLYVNWRTLEGLSVREPYEVQYLGHETSLRLPGCEVMA